jgi:large subunit ribosomal protein L25
MPIDLGVKVRSEFGSSESRRIRRSGQVPGIVYGKGGDDVAINVDEKLFMTVVGYSTASGLLDLVYEDDKRRTSVIVKNVQWDPISDRPIHVDFLRVSADQLVTIPVHVHLVNTPKGAIMGGVLEHILHEIMITVRAADIPHAINVNVENLDIGDSFHISEIEFPEGVIADMAGELVVATVVAPTVIALEEKEEELEGEEGVEGADAADAGETGERTESE